MSLRCPGGRNAARLLSQETSAELADAKKLGEPVGHFVRHSYCTHATVGASGLFEDAALHVLVGATRG